MKTIGILGGIGPQATMDFEARLHRAAQRAIPQRGNSGYPPLVTVYLRHPPVLVEADGLPREPLAIDPRVLQAAQRLGSWADLLVIPSNTPHLFLDEIAQAAGCEVVSLVDAALAALPHDDSRPVGLIGLGIPRVYAEHLAARGRATVTADEATRRTLDAAILRVMEGGETERDRASAHEALRQLRDGGAGKTILGCTEIPLLLGPAAEAPDLINPAEELAARVVQRALE